MFPVDAVTGRHRKGTRQGMECDMGNLKIQNQLHRINGAYQQCMDEMQAHGMDTNALVMLQIERFALMSLLLEEIGSLRAEIDALSQKDTAWHEA